MGTGLFLGVEPPVVAGGEFEGQLVILKVILAHIHMKAVTADIVKGTAGDPGFLRAAFSADVTALDQFLLDLHQIFFLHGDIQGRQNGLQMFDLFLNLYGQL